MEMLRRSIEIGWSAGSQPHRFALLARATLRQSAGPIRPKEAMMELRTRLNVLAAIVSFAFLTAVVFGMF
jgi:hypothetical protein